MARRCAYLLLPVLCTAGCLASSSETIDPLTGRDGGSRDARGVRDSGHRDIGLYFDNDSEVEAGPDGGLPYYSWDDDVEPIVRAKCQRCHSNPVRERAAYPLVVYQDTRRNAIGHPVLAYEEMARRVQDQNAPMPPRMGDMPPAPDPLTQDEIDIIVIWAAQGGPEHALPDAGIPDTGVEDQGVVDTGLTDTGVVDGGGPQNPLTNMGTLMTISSPYTLAEGPAWQASEGRLYFSDVGGNTIYTLTPPNTVTPFRTPSNHANGLGFDQNGALVACEHELRRVSRTQMNGTVIPFSAEYNMLPLNSPNDLVVRSDWIVYYTDPPYGLSDPMAMSDQGVNGIYRRSLVMGIATREDTYDLLAEAPNGLAFSPDESLLYVSETIGGFVYEYDVDPSGSLILPRRMFTSGLNGPDGLCRDDDGNIFVAAQGGVYVYAPDGSQWGSIPITGAVSNCAFGGASRTTLYITARSALMSVEMTIPGGQ